MQRMLLAAVSLALATAGSFAQTERVHRLEATPNTIAYGHYWSETPPVLRIASGDIIDVDTLYVEGAEPGGVLQVDVLSIGHFSVGCVSSAGEPDSSGPARCYLTGGTTWPRTDPDGRSRV